MTLWQTLIAYYLPRKWKSEKTNRILDMANQNLQRLERCLDVRALIETQQDVEELLASMVAKQRLWLFK